MRKFSKISMVIAVSLLVLLVSQPFASAAKAESVIPVAIWAKAYDPVGQALADQVTEAFKKTSGIW